MRILMLTWHYPPAIGGSERMAERLVHALANRGHTIEVWTARRDDAPPVESPHRNVVIRRRFRGIEFGPLFGISVFFQSLFVLWTARNRFDLIHSHQASWGSLGGAAARCLGGLPILVMIASSGPLNDVRRMRERSGGGLLVRLLRRADGFIALCRSARHELVDLGIPESRVVIVPNGIDLSHLETESPPPRSGEEILYVGRLYPIKGVDLLLRAFALVIRERPGVRLTILGDGPDRPALEALSRDLGYSAGGSPEAPGPVTFAGMHTEPLQFYSRASVVVLPSRTEGMSNVMIEAMALRSPIVATAVGGNSDLLDPEDRRSIAPAVERDGVFHGRNGLLVPPESPEALAAGILELLRDPSRAKTCGEAARAFIESHCTLDAVARQYETLYMKLLGTDSVLPPPSASP